MGGLGAVEGGKGRLLSLDAYRGFVMLAMASGGLGVRVVAQDFAGHPVWQAIDYQLDHVAWRGCAAWDLIQPSFLFIVGVAMPFSYESRRAQGQSWGRLFAHAVWRSLVLIALGVFLASAWERRTSFTFTGVLAQIGLGYTFVFLLLGRRPWVQLLVALAILAGDWALFALHDTPEPGALNGGMGLSPGWHRLTGFSQHWEKNVNIASEFDRWFLNRFPRPDGQPFIFNDGGYATLNFIPSIATMLFGVVAGEWLRGPRSATAKIQTLLIVGAMGIATASTLDGSLCPIVKRIWTPTWVLHSAGCTAWMLAFFYGTIDVAGFRRWAFPLVVVGVNSIAMYVMAQLLRPFFGRQLRVHLGPRIFEIPRDGANYGPIAESLAVLLVLWLICLWMYRKRIFIKI